MSACLGWGGGGRCVARGWGEGEGGYLDAVVAVGEVVHGLELLVDDADAGFVGAAGDLLDVLGRFAHVFELMVDVLGSLDGGLRVEFGYEIDQYPPIRLHLPSLTHQGRKP